MSDSLTLRRLRAFLLGLSAVVFLGAAAELLLVGHAEDAVQLTPYVLCGLGLLALAAVRLRPGPRSVLALRVAMVVVALGSLFGIVQHFLGNLELARETQPNADAAALFRAGIDGGTPLLAPGILAFTAAVALAATYGTREPETSDPRIR